MDKKILDEIANSYMGKPQMIPPNNDTYKDIMKDTPNIGNKDSLTNKIQGIYEDNNMFPKPLPNDTYKDIMKDVRNLLKGSGSGTPPPAAAMQPYKRR